MADRAVVSPARRVAFVARVGGGRVRLDPDLRAALGARRAGNLEEAERAIEQSGCGLSLPGLVCHAHAEPGP